jgi:hypothetical protein
MHQFGVLPDQFNVSSMIMPAADFNFSAFSSSAP